MTKIEFYPAVMVGHFNKITSQPENPEYKFWGKGSLFQYDKLLYSFYYLQDRYKKLNGSQSYFDSIGYIGKRMIDSGGFQVRTIGANINADDVLKIYARERADIGLILDIPMIGAWNDNFIKKTFNNVKYMVEHKNEIPNTELLNVSHGFSPKNRRDYYDIFKQFNDKLDGWAVGLIKRMPPIFNAWSFLFLYENDTTLKDKRFHFLGLTGNKNIPMVYYLAKLNLVKNISFDSTKYGREGIMSDMRNPSYMQERLSISKNAFGKLKSNKFCPCPICQNIPMERMSTDCNFSILHNLFWENKKFQFFDSFATADDLKNHIMNSKDFYKETRIAINFIDYALKHGLTKAEQKFASELIIKNVPKKQITLGDF